MSGCSPKTLLHAVPFLALWLTLNNKPFRGQELTRTPIMALMQLSRKLSRHRRQNLLHYRTRIQILHPNNLRYFVIFLCYCIPYLGLFLLCSFAPFYSSFLFSLFAFVLGCAFFFASFVCYVIPVCFLSGCIHFDMPRFFTCLSHFVAFIFSATQSCLLACKGDPNILSIPSLKGFSPQPCLPWDL